VTRCSVGTPARLPLRANAAQSMGLWPGDSRIFPRPLFEAPARCWLLTGGPRFGRGPFEGARREAVGLRLGRGDGRPGGAIRLLGLGAGGGIRDEEAGLGGGGIARLGEMVVVALTVVFEFGAWSATFATGGATLTMSGLSLPSLLRENEGTGSPF
jgi:hypothetical protein